MIGSWSKLKRNVSWDWITTPPSLSWSSHIANLRKKKKFNASIKPILEYFVCVWGSCNAGLLDEIFKVQKRCARVILDAPFQARILPLFLELGWLPINQIFIERRLLLLNKIVDKCAPDYLSEKLLSLKYHCSKPIKLQKFFM